MKTIIFCEGTTDILLLQFVLQYKYDWKYNGFVENTVTNRLLKRKLIKGDSTIELNSCGGIMNIPNMVLKIEDILKLATKKEELFDKVIIMIDHDTVESNKEFIEQINEKLSTNFVEEQINTETDWMINNAVMGTIMVKLLIKSIPESETGAIETVLLEALGTDELEKSLISDSTEFVEETAKKQNRYLQKKSRISKAVFNTYFAIRAPEEKYDERSRILRAYNWKDNNVLSTCFDFLDI